MKLGFICGVISGLFALSSQASVAKIWQVNCRLGSGLNKQNEPEINKADTSFSARCQEPGVNGELGNMNARFSVAGKDGIKHHRDLGAIVGFSKTSCDEIDVMLTSLEHAPIQLKMGPTAPIKVYFSSEEYENHDDITYVSCDPRVEVTE